MKIAITADLHLTSREQNPERFQTLENILKDMSENGVEVLVIAGDLFDASRQNYSEFEQLFRDLGDQNLSIAIIPGNHDFSIDEQKIVVGGARIFNSPRILNLGDRPFLFLPYREGKTMGEEITPFSNRLPPGEWVLVAHGDWAGGMRTPNPTEPGVYMPLTRRDIELYKPARVFLGHIHSPMDAPPVHYVGSPCGLDINESGRRRCLIYDTDTNRVEGLTLRTPVLFFNESFVIVPVDDEADYLRAQIESRKQKWALTPEERSKTQLRIKVAGYSADRAALRSMLREAFDEFSFYKNQEPDIDEVNSSDDMERHYIVEQVRSSLENLVRPDGSDEPSNDDILLKALHIIYGN